MAALSHAGIEVDRLGLAAPQVDGPAVDVETEATYSRLSQVTSVEGRYRDLCSRKAWRARTSPFHTDDPVESNFSACPVLRQTVWHRHPALRSYLRRRWAV